MILVYTLTKQEMKFIHELTLERERRNNLVGAKGTPYGGRTIINVCYNGYSAEYAFSKISGLKFNDSTEPRIGGVDTYTKTGKSIDVKQSGRKRQTLLVKTIKATDSRRCDYYCFMYGIVPTFRYLGFATYDQVVRCKTISPHGEESTAFTVPLAIVKANLSKQLEGERMEEVISGIL